MRLQGRSTWVVCFAAAVGALGCGKETDRPGGDPGAVYRELLRAQTARPGWPKGRILLSTRRAVLDSVGLPEPDRWESFRRALPGLQRDTYEHYMAAQDVEEIVRPELHEVAGVPIEVVSGDTIDELGWGGDLSKVWDRIREARGDAVLVELSAVGFDRDRDQALVQMNALHWFGAHFLLEQSEAGWNVVEQHEFSESVWGPMDHSGLDEVSHD